MDTILQCSRGHDKTPENTFGKNQCRPCHKFAVAAYEKTPKAKAYRKVQADQPISRLYKSEWYAKNKQRMADYARTRRYGLSPEQYRAMLETQEGKCAVCGIHGYETSKGLVVDHKKGTKIVRGLLCNICNSHVVHVVEDYSSRIEKARAYLGGV